MQEDGEEKTKGLAKRQLERAWMSPRGRRMSRLCGQRRVDTPCEQDAVVKGDGLTGVKECVRQCLSILDMADSPSLTGMGTGPERFERLSRRVLRVEVETR
jgi:hypothetical protein